MLPKAVFFFLFSISLAYSFSVSMTPFPTNMTAGMTYQSQMQITSLGPFNSIFYLNITGINASNEIEANMDLANCSFDSIWICAYSQAESGVYLPIMRLKLNELLDPSGDYSYRLDYLAIEDTSTSTSAPTRSYYSSSGGASFAPRAYTKPSPPAPVKNDTPKPSIPTPAQNTTASPEAVVNQTIEPTAQNETDWWPPTAINYTVLPIQIITPDAEPSKDDFWAYVLPAIAIGFFIIGVLVFGVYLITRKKEV